MFAPLSFLIIASFVVGASHIVMLCILGLRACPLRPRRNTRALRRVLCTTCSFACLSLPLSQSWASSSVMKNLRLSIIQGPAVWLVGSWLCTCAHHRRTKKKTLVRTIIHWAPWHSDSCHTFTDELCRDVPYHESGRVLTLQLVHICSIMCICVSVFQPQEGQIPSGQEESKMSRVAVSPCRHARCASP